MMLSSQSFRWHNDSARIVVDRFCEDLQRIGEGAYAVDPDVSRHSAIVLLLMDPPDRILCIRLQVRALPRRSKLEYHRKSRLILRPEDYVRSSEFALAYGLHAVSSEERMHEHHHDDLVRVLPQAQAVFVGEDVSESLLHALRISLSTACTNSEKYPASRGITDSTTLSTTLLTSSFGMEILNRSPFQGNIDVRSFSSFIGTALRYPAMAIRLYSAFFPAVAVPYV